MNMLYRDIGCRIAALRQEQKITQAQLAEKLDISIKHCSEVERGLTCPSLEKLVALCPILSTDLDYLIRGIDRRCAEESGIPSFVIDLFNNGDKDKKEWLLDYLLLFKRITEKKGQP